MSSRGPGSRLTALAVVAVLAGCAAAPRLSPMQIRQLTTRTIEGSREDTFRAVLTVLQDQGYSVRNTDMESGLISAYAARHATGPLGLAGDKGTGFDLSALVTPLSERHTEVRLTIRKSYEGGRTVLARVTDRGPEVYDAEVLQEFFNQILVEVKRRQAMVG